MDPFGWSTQPPAAPSCPSDDALLAAFLGGGFQLHPDGGDGTVRGSDAYGLDLPSSSQHDLSLLRCHDGVTAVPSDVPSSAAYVDSVGFLPIPAIAGAHDGLLLDRLAFPSVPEEPAQAAGSNTAFSGYSTTTGGGGNISSGESANTYGGHDTEVASSPCAGVSPPVLLPPSKRRLLNKHPAALGASATTSTAEERWGTKRAVAMTSSITFGHEPDTEAIAQVKEMIYRAAAMRPVSLGGPSAVEPSAAAAAPDEPRRRKNVRISSDPQTVAARLRREKVSERLRALQRLVPGGSKMDTASMLDEAASYLRFLKSQLAALETLDGGGGSRSLQQRYVGGRSPWPSRASNGDTVQLSFGRDGIAGYVKSNRNMQL